MSKTTVRLDVDRDNGPRIQEAKNKFFNAIFRDVVRQASKKEQEDIVERLRSRVNQSIAIELREMQRVLVGSDGLIGRDIGRSPLRIQPTPGPEIWGRRGNAAPFDFTTVGWKPYSPAYEAAKQKKFPSRWRGWFLATGALRNELRSSSLFTPGGLGRQISVSINRRGTLSDNDIDRIGNGLSRSQRGDRSGEAIAEGPSGDSQRSRTGRLKLFNLRLRIFTDFTARELPFLSSGDVYDANSGGAILQKLNLSPDARRKLGPPTRHVGSSTNEVLTDKYRPVFEPLLQFFMAQRIPAAVAKALYEPSGRR